QVRDSRCVTRRRRNRSADPAQIRSAHAGDSKNFPRSFFIARRRNYNAATGSPVALLCCMRRTGIDLSDSLRGVYVLIVDDDPTGRTLLTAVLRYCAAYVHAVPSLGEAMTAMLHMVPDALIVDAMMSEDEAFAFM